MKGFSKDDGRIRGKDVPGREADAMGRPCGGDETRRDQAWYAIPQCEDATCVAGGLCSDEELGRSTQEEAIGVMVAEGPPDELAAVTEELGPVLEELAHWIGSGRIGSPVAVVVSDSRYSVPPALEELGEAEEVVLYDRIRRPRASAGARLGVEGDGR